MSFLLSILSKQVHAALYTPKDANEESFEASLAEAGDLATVIELLREQPTLSEDLLVIIQLSEDIKNKKAEFVLRGLVNRIKQSLAVKKRVLEILRL